MLYAGMNKDNSAGLEINTFLDARLTQTQNTCATGQMKFSCQIGNIELGKTTLLNVHPRLSSRDAYLNPIFYSKFPAWSKTVLITYNCWSFVFCSLETSSKLQLFFY